MPKILLIPEFDKFGGTRTFFENLIHVYASQGYEVVLLLFRSQLDAELSTILHKLNFRYNVICNRPHLFKKLMLRFPISVLFDFFVTLPIILKERPDLVVASIGTPGSFLGLFILPIKFLYILHTYPGKSKLSKIKSLFFKLYLCNKKIILLGSGYSKRKVLSYWLAQNNSEFVQLLYNTIKMANPFKKDLGISVTDVNRVLTLGHVTWYKNPETWIKAAQIVLEKLNYMNIEFIWAGDGDQLDQYIEVAKSLNPSKIKFIGHKKNVVKLYETCTVYFQPSRMESHGLSVVEAMSWGLPCVVSNEGGLPESVKDGETGYVMHADDAEGMAKKIIFLLENQNIAGEMGSAARDYYKEKFSYPVWEKNMIQIHDQLIGH